MTVRVVRFGSAEQLQTIELRRQVLRRPLGLDFTEVQLRAESEDVHLGLFEEDDLVACLILTPKSPLLKMRQVAVRTDRQGRGVGRTLVEGSEEWAKAHGFARIVLNARETAVPFYIALGYAIEGDPFEEVGIPHRAMSKEL